jgi:hypothetical protein
MEIWYRISIWVIREAARGTRWNDPVFGPLGPEPVRIASGEACAPEDYLS